MCMPAQDNRVRDCAVASDDGAAFCATGVLPQDSQHASASKERESVGLLMPMTRAEADAYDLSDNTAENSAFLTACGLAEGSAQSALTLFGSGACGWAAACTRDGRQADAGHLSASGEPDLALARAVGPGDSCQASDLGSQGQWAAAARDRTLTVQGLAPLWFQGPPGDGSATANPASVRGAPADEAVLAGLFENSGGLGAIGAVQPLLPAQPLSAPSRSVPAQTLSSVWRSLLPCAAQGEEPNGAHTLLNPYELGRGLPGSLPGLGACDVRAALAAGRQPCAMALGCGRGPAEPGDLLGLDPGSGLGLATPELHQSDLQLSLGMGLGLRLDLGSWHYGSSGGPRSCGLHRRPLEETPFWMSSGSHGGALPAGFGAVLLERVREGGAAAAGDCGEGGFLKMGGMPALSLRGPPALKLEAQDAVRCLLVSPPCG